MTKIDVFSGFLGAGKTTLIKKLIREGYKGEKLVLIENEFGEIGIDGGFLKDAGIAVNEINSGCICCSLVGDFGRALGKVMEEYHPDRILIEPSGVGKLSDVIRAIEGANLAGAVLNSSVAVVDAKKCKMYMKNFGEFFNDQIQNAKTLIFSHTAALSDEKLELALSLVREQNSSASVITTDWDQLSGEAILQAMDGAASLQEELARLEEDAKHHHHHHHHDHDEECDCGCHGHEHHHHHDHDHDEECDCGCHGHEHHHHHDHDHDEECDCGCHEHEPHHHHHDHDEEGDCGCHGHEHHHHHDHDEDCDCGCHEHEHHHHHDHDHDEERDCGCHGHGHHHHHDHDHDEECDCGCHGHGHHHHHHADEVFSSWGVETAQKLSEDAVRAALDAFSEGDEYGMILRAKGIVQGTDGAWIHFDYVPGEPDVRHGSADVIGRLCVIGSNLDKAAITRLFGIGE